MNSSDFRSHGLCVETSVSVPGCYVVDRWKRKKMRWGKVRRVDHGRVSCFAFPWKKDSRAKIWFGDLLSVNRSVVVKSVIGSGRYCCTLPRNLCSHGPITVRPSLSTTTSTEQVRHVACSVYTIDCLLSTTTSFSDSFRDCCIPLAELNGWTCDTETVVWMRCCVVHFRASGGKLLAAPLP